MWMCLYRGVPLTRGLSPCCSQGLFFYSNCMNLPICFQGPVLCFQGMCERNQSIVLCVTNKVLQKYSSKNPHRSTHTQKKMHHTYQKLNPPQKLFFAAGPNLRYQTLWKRNAKWGSTCTSGSQMTLSSEAKVEFCKWQSYLLSLLTERCCIQMLFPARALGLWDV